MSAPLARKPLSNTEYLLTEIRLARAHASVWVNTLDTLGVALKAGLIHAGDGRFRATRVRVLRAGRGQTDRC